MRYRIIADSSSNIYNEDSLFSDNKQEYVSVPLKIITSDKEYEDTEGNDTTEMVEDLRHYKGKSGTSCPNVSDWLGAFGDADVIFGVTLTGTLSGCYSAAVQAKNDYIEEHPDAKVLILNSLSTGPEMELIVEKLKELIDEGQSFENIEKEIKSYMDRTHLLFSLESLKNLVNNGRVNPAVATVAGVLGIRIVGKASDEGTLQPLHKCRREKQMFRIMTKEMRQEGFSGGKVRIAHCMNEKGAELLADIIKENFGECDITIRSCGALCSFYAEKGGLLLGFEG
ncbi:MAG: DegV family protein [Lachnospiraceae bacterium]|nr:DegV family protein [Lachnospiraceae bacterium]